MMSVNYARFLFMIGVVAKSKQFSLSSVYTQTSSPDKCQTSTPRGKGVIKVTFTCNSYLTYVRRGMFSLTYFRGSLEATKGNKARWSNGKLALNRMANHQVGSHTMTIATSCESRA